MDSRTYSHLHEVKQSMTKTAFTLTLDEYEELAGEFTNEKLQGDTHIADRLMLSAFIIWLRLKTKENSSGETTK